MDLEDHPEASEDRHQEDLEAAEALMTAAPLTLEPEVAAAATSRRTFLEFPETITPSLPRFLTPPSSVTARPRADTTLTLRPSARLSTSAAVMATAASPSTASSAPTAPCSTSSTLSATGGSMLTVPWPSSSTASMTRLLLRERLTHPLGLAVTEVTKVEPRLEVEEARVAREVREAELEAGGDLRAPPPLPEAPTPPPLEVTLGETLLATLASGQLTLGTAPRLAAPSADTAAGGATPGTSTCPTPTRSWLRSTTTDQHEEITRMRKLVDR